jgi:hypothetical protein
MKIIDGLKVHQSHEWIKVEGIKSGRDKDYAQGHLVKLFLGNCRSKHRTGRRG